MSVSVPPLGFTLILGLDPGSKHTGFGLITACGEQLNLVAQGRFSPTASWTLARRLAYIHKGLSELIAGHRPQDVAVEDIFYGPNVRSALRLGHVRGVALLAAAQGGAEVFEYAPRLVKNTVAGYGQADKAQVADMVGRLLKIEGVLPPDASDALAVAICHAGQCRLRSVLPVPGKTAASRGGGSWRKMSEADLAALNYGAK